MLLEVPSLATTFKDVYSYIYIYFLPLRVSAPVGHLQEEYTIIPGTYCTYNGSVVLCALLLLGSIYNLFSKFCHCQLNVCVCVV
jgi:hypothetical protein